MFFSITNFPFFNEKHCTCNYTVIFSLVIHVVKSKLKCTFFFHFIFLSLLNSDELSTPVAVQCPLAYWYVFFMYLTQPKSGTHTCDAVPTGCYSHHLQYKAGFSTISVLVHIWLNWEFLFRNLKKEKSMFEKVIKWFWVQFGVGKHS